MQIVQRSTATVAEVAEAVRQTTRAAEEGESAKCNFDLFRFSGILQFWF